MSKAENTLTNRLRYLVQELDSLSRLFRNHRGKVQDKRTDRWHEFGLAPGASDGIGWHSVVITPAMVGRRVAVFVAVELKSDERAARRGDERTRQQRRFLDSVQRAGGVGLMAWEEAQVREALDRATARVGVSPPAQ